MTLFGISYYKWLRPFAWFCITASIVTWVLDLFNLVEACPYCQVQRTVIGFLGLLLLLRKQTPVTDVVSLVLGFFGAYVASRQVFNNFLKSAYDAEFIYLASAALVLIIVQTYALMNINRFKRAG